jgi:hypothetical protein
MNISLEINQQSTSKPNSKGVILRLQSTLGCNEHIQKG